MRWDVESYSFDLSAFNRYETVCSNYFFFHHCSTMEVVFHLFSLRIFALIRRNMQLSFFFWLSVSMLITGLGEMHDIFILFNVFKIDFSLNATPKWRTKETVFFCFPFSCIAIIRLLFSNIFFQTNGFQSMWMSLGNITGTNSSNNYKMTNLIIVAHRKKKQEQFTVWTSSSFRFVTKEWIKSWHERNLVCVPFKWTKPEWLGEAVHWTWI